MRVEDYLIQNVCIVRAVAHNVNLSFIERNAQNWLISIMTMVSFKCDLKVQECVSTFSILKL